MDILIIGSRSYPPQIGGLERYIYEFSINASKMGHDVTVITQKHGDESKEEVMDGVKVIRCYAPKTKPIDRIFLYFNTLLKKKGDFDIYWGHGTIGTLIHNWRPYVYTIHGFTSMREDKNPVMNRLLKKWEYDIIDRTDMNICVDLKSYNIAKEINPNSYLVENGVDISRFSEDLKNPFEHGSKNVLFVGRLVESKGILDIIRGFREYPTEAELHIVGSGPLHEKVKDISGGNIVYHGRVDSVEEYFQHADCYVLPSYHEGFPTTVLEAMAAKTPTVVTDLPAFEGNFEDGVETMIFEPGDVEGMMDKIELVLKDDSICDKMIGKAYLKVNQEYTWEVQTKKILSLFEDLIKESQT